MNAQIYLYVVLKRFQKGATSLSGLDRGRRTDQGQKEIFREKNNMLPKFIKSR